jgi:lipoprotein-releasing system ATP-binding protein
MVDSVLEARNIKKVYGTSIKTEVLHGVSFKLSVGEFASIIGYSGSGKSTLLNILGALDTPTSGEIFFKGQDYGKISEDALADFRNQNMGFIFQFHHLLPEFTALENVLIPTWIKMGNGSNKYMSKAKQLLDLVGLKEFVNKRSTNLSGGQQQRVAIARALINDPAILLGDEPTGNLDTETTQQVYELFRDINKKLGTTVLIVTHNDQIAAKSDRIIELRDGNISRDYTHKDMI